MNVVPLKKPGIRNETELKRFVKHHASAKPDEMVQAINISIELSTTAENVADNHRLNAGKMLLELRADIEGRGENFWKWQVGKFTRSRKDIERLMRYARADDPVSAEREERGKQRERMQRHRNGAHVRSEQPSDIEQILDLIEALTDQERTELRDACKERWSW